MNPTAPPQKPEPEAPAVADEHEQILAANQVRNFLALSVYQIILRSGWIFKTESIIMPAVLDLITHRPAVRAMLPLLNRLGQSLPPLIASQHAQAAPKKSRMLLGTTLVMAACFALLAVLWYVTDPSPNQPAPWWLPAVFLLFYGVFFASMGVNGLVFSTTQAKLIETTRRGRLLGFSNVIGAGVAIACALALLPLWLKQDAIDVVAIFGFAAGCFFLSAVALLFLVEPAERTIAPRVSFGKQMAEISRPVRRDRNFRKLLYVGAMYGASMGLFPHYQSVGLDVVQLPLTRLLWWLIMQNIGMGLFSMVAGPLADWFGNRLVVWLSMLGLCAAPVLTVIFAAIGPSVGPWYDAVFVLVGLTPVTFRTLQNYALEIAPEEEQSRYLSALSLSMASTLILSPVLGFVMEAAGFTLVFWLVTAMIASGWLMSLWLIEPRHLSPAAARLTPLDSELG